MCLLKKVSPKSVKEAQFNLQVFPMAPSVFAEMARENNSDRVQVRRQAAHVEFTFCFNGRISCFAFAREKT